MFPVRGSILDNRITHSLLLLIGNDTFIEDVRHQNDLIKRYELDSLKSRSLAVARDAS